MSYNTGVGQRTAVVTGAAAPRGIGYATARRFAAGRLGRCPARHRPGRGQERRAAPARSSTCRASGSRVDVTDPDSIQRSVTEIAEAACLRSARSPTSPGWRPLCRSSRSILELWRKVIDVNLTSTFLMSQAYLPQMIENGYGRIVNMSSVSAQQGGGVFSKTPYSAAKAGISGLTRSLAREMALHGITVNAVSPAWSTPTSAPERPTPRTRHGWPPPFRSAARPPRATSPRCSSGCPARTLLHHRRHAQHQRRLLHRLIAARAER